jgi:hypothetical protein
MVWCDFCAAGKSANSMGSGIVSQLKQPCASPDSGTSPAFDHYDFLLPRDQIVGLLLDNSLDVEM